ncbi:hypothetical protein [Saccharothrix obliqua]|uniref:hypothetical protein n=1 Tax=Saccharothrix obliqua TaxID=2861747 RepID=UPI001C5CD35B|nr:hypothetical protein [Saccharothrix obliqua]MBW4717624.1 hypothetical protein [Saccharothrix obliqua]
MVAWLPLVLSGLLAELWEYGPLVGVVALLGAAWLLRDARLVAADAVFAVAVVYGVSPLPAAVAFAGAVVLAAHDLHARRPGAWFPLLTAGLVVLVGWLGSLWLADRPFRAWRPEAPAYRTTEPAWASADDFTRAPDLPVVLPYAVAAVLLAGAAVLLGRRREWAALVAVGLLSAVWEQGPPAGVVVLTALAGAWRSPRLAAATAVFGVAAWFEPQPFPVLVALAAALLLAAHDRHAHRPGAWFPLLATGLGLVTATLDARPLNPPDAFGWFPYAEFTLENHEMSAVTAVAVTMTAEVHMSRVLAVVVAMGLALWAWRTRDLLVLAVAAAHLAAAWYLPGRPEPVVVAGAAVAWVRDGRTAAQNGWTSGWKTCPSAGTLRFTR